MTRYDSDVRSGGDEYSIYMHKPDVNLVSHPELRRSPHMLDTWLKVVF